MKTKKARNGIMTVKQLRDLIAGLDDSTQVVIAQTVSDSDGWYDNISAVDMPDGDDDANCVTIYHGKSFDTRQQ